MFQEGKILAGYEQGNQIIELQERNQERSPGQLPAGTLPARDALEAQRKIGSTGGWVV